METLPPPVLARDPFDWAATLALIQRAFAAMEGGSDPPSSLRDLTTDGLRTGGALWVIGAPPVACMILAPRTDALYLGKLAVDPAHQGLGLGRAMVAHAIAQARALGLPAVELQTRIELTENHAFFARLGFVKRAETAHPGYLRPTSFTYRIEV
jgi:GNAT superfamily N-acetyltransferase